MNIKTLVSLLTIITLLSGCSSISKIDCLNTNWQQIGLDDGQRGIANDSASSYLVGCTDPEVDVDMTAYNLGHEKGMALFCQTDNGFELGKDGYEYSIACPTAFNDEYMIGYQFYTVNSNISKVEDAITANANDINKLESGISNANLQLSSDDLSTSEETALRQNVDSMTGQIQGYEQNNALLLPALQQLQQQLQNLKSTYGR